MSMNEKSVTSPAGPYQVKADESSEATPRASQPSERPASKVSPLRVIGILAGAYALVVIALGIYWSPPFYTPERIDIGALQQELVGNAGGQAMPGTAVVAAAIGVAETLVNKRGGLLYNDMAPPGLYLDNMPSWEYGALKELRDSVRSLRNDFSRSATQSIENDHIKRADVKLAIDASSWIFPSAEEEYRQALDGLQLFMRDLSRGQDRTARFFTRADNLASYLSVVEKRLGSLALRLSASVGDKELTAGFVRTAMEEDVEFDIPSDPGSHRTPWNEVDDVFYEARGYTWALLHMMEAIRIDFADVIAIRNADVTVAQIIRDLEGATKPMVSPVVLNGHGYGFLSNHSLVMGSYISRANAAVLDLRLMMQQ
jgi:hypothetical protein